MKIVIASFAFLIFSASCYGQGTDSVSRKDYAQAEKMLTYNTNKYFDTGSLRPRWFSQNKFSYFVSTVEGKRYVIGDAEKGKPTVAFDHQKLAQALSQATKKNYKSADLPLKELSFSADEKSIDIKLYKEKWTCDLTSFKCTPGSFFGPGTPAGDNEIASPDGKKAAFIRAFNLWVRDLATGTETQLTTDGKPYYGYATDNAGWRHSDKPIVRWSPDSRKIATFQQDERKVGKMYLVTTNVGHPKLESWKYPLPGDSVIAMIERAIINVDTPGVIRLNVPPDPHRGTLSDDISVKGKFSDVDWSPDATHLAFVSTSRDHKEATFRIADAVTGEVRDVFTEKVSTQYESGQGAVNWRYLPGSNEIIWYSERNNWGHLYLYDATTGALKHEITKGDYVVTQLLYTDENKRTLYFLANGKEPGNPYYSYFYKIGFDGNDMQLLTPVTGNHEISISPSGEYFTDRYSQPDVPPVLDLRTANGKLISTLEKTDMTDLLASGWRPPKIIQVKAADGKADLYGLMFTPKNPEQGKKHPTINYIYPGPQGGSVGSWSFIPSRNDNQALTELGFVVVAIEGTSNPLRSKSYHDMSYGNMAENTIPDQITGIKQLAEKYKYIDTSRIGIWGHSGGGFATATAMFRYPDFFKVGIAESGNHDNRNYEDDWGERYNGLLTRDASGKDNYQAQANQLYAKNLKGKLMLAHGMLDDNVPPYNTLLVVEALEKANKDFDLVIFPNVRHGYGDYKLYMMRRRWDYFVKYLMGKEPPKEYNLSKNDTTDDED